jgi:hypothetical protein
VVVVVEVVVVAVLVVGVVVVAVVLVVLVVADSSSVETVPCPFAGCVTSTENVRGALTPRLPARSACSTSAV